MANERDTCADAFRFAFFPELHQDKLPTLRAAGYRLFVDASGHRRVLKRAPVLGGPWVERDLAWQGPPPTLG